MYNKLLVLFYFYVPLLAELALVILNIIIAAGKVRQTKILGISGIFSSAGGLIVSVVNLIWKFGGSMQMLSITSMMRTVVGFVFSLAASFFICLYIHRVYKKRHIYFPIMLLPVVSIGADLIAARIIESPASDLEGLYRVNMYSMSQSVISLLSSCAFAAILVVVFYKNRKIEKIIPHAFVFYIINLVTAFITHAVSVADYAVRISTFYKIDNNAELADLVDKYTLGSSEFLIFFNVICALINLAFPIYVLIRVRRAGRVTEETQGIEAE